MENPFKEQIHLDILRKMVKGDSLRKIAETLKQDYEYIKWCVKWMKQQAGAGSNEELTYFAGQYGWV